jgi:hypothetical protein
MTVLTVSAPVPDTEERDMFRQAVQESMDRRDQGGE